MKEMFQTLNQHRKENPKDFYASIGFIVLFSVIFYKASCLVAVVEGMI
jgi:ribosomal protein S15P/S13E